MARWLSVLGLMILLAAPVARADQTDPRLDPLFERLKAAPNAEAAAPIEGAIWAIWIDTEDPAAEQLMVTGLSAMRAGLLDIALLSFDRLVVEKPDFAEAWNKRATVHFLRGEFTQSLADIDHTLALEPRHFGALSGLGMIRAAQGQASAAADAFYRALEIYPTLRGARQQLKRLGRQEQAI